MLSFFARQLSYKERIELFIDQINKLQYRFGNALEAYAHMKVVLDTLEEKHSLAAIAPTVRMTMPEFEFFNHANSFHLYYFATPRHVIFIHENGSYGICQKKFSLSDEVVMDLYACDQHPLVCLSNIHHVSLWNMPTTHST